MKSQLGCGEFVLVPIEMMNINLASFLSAYKSVAWIYSISAKQRRSV